MKITVVLNRLKKKPKLNLDWYAKRGITFEFLPVIKTDFDLTYKTVGNATYSGVIVDDTILPKLRTMIKEGQTDVVVFMYGNKASGIRLSCIMDNPLYYGTEVIQLVSDKKLAHEAMHFLFKRLSRQGIVLQDPMDQVFYQGELRHYFNDHNPDAIPSNWSIAMDRLKPYLKNLETMKPQEPDCKPGDIYSHKTGLKCPLQGSTSPNASTLPTKTISSSGVDLIASFEGLRLSPYTDSAGIWTIGYGSIYDLQGKRITSKTPSLTLEQAKELLKKSITSVTTFINKIVKAPLTQNQYDAVCSLTYNIGIGNLQKSNLLKNINSGKPVVKDNFVSWNKAGGKVIKGLILRREREYALYIK